METDQPGAASTASAASTLKDASTQGAEEATSVASSEPEDKILPYALLELPYIPDFLLSDVRIYFVPSKESPKEVYHELVGESAKNWSSYYSKKGWAFTGDDDAMAAADGPYKIADKQAELEILEPGRIFSPKPQFRFEPDGDPLPLVSLDKRRPLNPWKPNFLKSLEFIRKYDWLQPLPRRAQMAIYEIEECGEIAGSTSWMNGEDVLRRIDSHELRETLHDVFFNRPEDYPLGSSVYLRVLGHSGSKGFEMLLELAKHPISRKRICVAQALGDRSFENSFDAEISQQGSQHRGRLEALLMLLEDEDPYVRKAALKSLGRIGLREGDDPRGIVASCFDDEEGDISQKVWAAQALLATDENYRKYLLGLVKEDPRPLTDLGELGEVIEESGLFDAVPFLIHRLKDKRVEVSMDAAEALNLLTGLGLEFNAEESANQTRMSIKTFQRWWEEKKRERRARR